jgi:hypothetical protein
MCRKCIAAICYELGETKESLHKRILALRDQQKIDSKLITWSDVLRMIGTDAAHDLYLQIGKSDAHYPKNLKKVSPGARITSQNVFS